MVTKRIRSEYMKKFKDPKWETYAKCYENLVSYRLSRRMLEQTHNPWFWDESGSDTESSDSYNLQERTKEFRLQKEKKATTDKETSVNKEHGVEEETEPDTRQISEQITEAVKPQETEKDEETEPAPVVPDIPAETNLRVQSRTKSKPKHSYKSTRTKAKHHITKDTEKETRHPFAMYGSGERQADMAQKRTHNVRPATSTKEIHESALRAKNRRELEKEMKRMDKRRAKSADLEKLTKSKVVPDYNPWMTEYMCHFSARSP
ncbi:Centriole, cilia and spindle-associated protein [Bagarius yarrelli]|uniref:Centriole, cilia and spindle-associated protein n=1 Tax=Bagarius yarrelli TaxID=175774 RepID=A0A556TMR6_BAGYA|nr:Centriole, cilia and spindle-associated protein [Bagarius yarrelli]